MKILCVIDSFGSGGAQRQLVNLACGLKNRGHCVDTFVYYPNQEFFKPDLDKVGIPVHSVTKNGRLGLGVLVGLIKHIRVGTYDVVISFLDTPNTYSTISCLFSPGTRLIVSERSSYRHDKSRAIGFLKRLLHGLAYKVVANSKTQARWLKQFPWLKGKTVAIYNGYPLPRDDGANVPMPPLRFLVVGRVGPEKNGIRLVQALVIFEKRYGFVPEISWAGKEDILPSGQAYITKLKALLDSYPSIKSKWKWLGERRDVFDLLKTHRALIHPSLYEGLPNVICEAFMCARPVIASRVCDHPDLIGNNDRGFLFDPNDPSSICEALAACANLSEESWVIQSKNAFAFSQAKLGIDRFVDEYERLLA
jgi:glycosyltransferase involved in cell wall biosynthesis